MWHEQLGADFIADFRDVGVGGESGDFEDQFARQRITIGMEAKRRQSQQKVAGADGARLGNAAALDDADDKSGEVVFARRIGIGQLGRFASDQGAIGLVARAGDAVNELFDDVGIHAAERQVVEEKERLGAERENVVDAMID